MQLRSTVLVLSLALTIQASVADDADPEKLDVDTMVAEEEDIADLGDITTDQYIPEPADGSECYMIPNGLDYRGIKSRTRRGYTCQRWTSQSPHQHTITPDKYTHAGLGDHNYCRNPNGAERPWCYTTSSSMLWDYCDVGNKKTSCPVERKGSGFVYTRWGNSFCPGNAQLVYSGATVGKHYNHRGDGSNYLCLPKTPKYSYVTSGVQSDRSRLYPTEYRSTHGAYSNIYHDVPCAVCLQEYRNNYIVYPARDDCPGGWTREYYGYLMSADDSHHSTEFVCVDKAGVKIPGTASSASPSILYPTEGMCISGSGIPCSPYVNGYELTCAVCSK